MKKMLWILSALGALLILGSAFTAQADGGLKEIKKIYKKHCKICHAKDGSAETKQGKKSKTTDWRDGEIWKKVDDATSKKIILEGKGKMKAYKDKIEADKVDALLAYCKTLSKPVEAAPKEAAPVEAAPAAPEPAK